MSNTVAFLLLPQFGLLVVVPVMSKRLGLGEPVMLVLFTFMQVFSKYIFLLKKHSMRLSNPSVSVGTFSAAFAGTMLGFFASVWLTALLLCAFGPASALLTRQLRTLVFTAKNFLKTFKLQIRGGGRNRQGPLGGCNHSRGGASGRWVGFFLLL